MTMIAVAKSARMMPAISRVKSAGGRGGRVVSVLAEASPAGAGPVGDICGAAAGLVVGAGAAGAPPAAGGAVVPAVGALVDAPGAEGDGTAGVRAVGG